MNSHHLRRALLLAIQANVPSMVWGHAGIGKSQIVAGIARELELPFIDLRLATQEPGDLIGIPYTNPITNQTEWARPSWWPEGPAVLFLDELNRGNKEVIQAIFQLVLDRRMHTHILPEGVRIIAAGNPPEGDYNTDALDAALVSRFMHLSLESHVQSWIDNCKDFIDETVLAYVGTAKNELNQLKGTFTTDTIVRPTERTWEFVGKVYNAYSNKTGDWDRNTLLNCVSGLVGPQAGHNYVQSLERAWTTVEDILSGKKTFADMKKANDQTDMFRLCIIFPNNIKKNFSQDANGNKDPKRLANFKTFITDLANAYDDVGVGLVKQLLKLNIGPISQALATTKFMSMIQRNTESAGL